MSTATYKLNGLEVASTKTSSLRSPIALLVFGLVVLGLTAVPYQLAERTAPAGTHFMGIVMNVPDTAQYFSWARESRSAVLVENKLTPESGTPVYFNLFWLGVGRVAAAAGLEIPEAAQLVRLIAGALYLSAMYWFVGLMLPDAARRWVAFLVAALGGGLGWVLVVQKYLAGATDVSFPLDLYVMEANAFLTILAFPLQATAGALLLFALGFTVLALERASLRLAAVAGGTGLLLGLLHGYDLLVLYTIVGGTTLALVLARPPRFKLLLVAAVACGLSLPAAVYNVYITRTSPIWQGVLAQYGNAGVYTPPPPHLLVLMGLPLLLTSVGTVVWLFGRTGGFRLPRTRTPSAPAREILLWVWLVAGFALLYIPTDFQIKMLVDWHVPLGVLATRMVFAFVRSRAGRRLPRPRVRQAELLVGCLFVLATLPTNAYLFGWRVLDLGRHDYPYYLRTDDLTALRWLEAHSSPHDVVLSSLTVGQYIPSVTGSHAFLAHWAGTLDYRTKVRDVAHFFDASVPDSFRQDLIQRFAVRYVFYGAAERALGDYDLEKAPFLEKVSSAGSTAVYRVRPLHDGDSRG